MKLFRQFGDLNRHCRPCSQPLDHFAQDGVFDRIKTGTFPFDHVAGRFQILNGSRSGSVENAVQSLRKTQSAFIEPGFHAGKRDAGGIAEEIVVADAEHGELFRNPDSRIQSLVDRPCRIPVVFAENRTGTRQRRQVGGPLPESRCF